MERSDLGPLLTLGLCTGLAAFLVASRPIAPRSMFDPDMPAPILEERGADVHLEVPAGLEVRYTRDGSEPGPGSALWTGDLRLLPDEHHAQRMIREPSSPQWRAPLIHAAADAAVLRWCGCDPESRCGPVSTRTLLAERSSLPVFSLVLDDGALFDPDTGIYVVGHGIFRDDELAVQRYPRDQKWWKYPGNYQFRGERWERTAHLEVMNTGPGQPWSGDVKLRINGNNTRGFPQHALRVILPEAPAMDLVGAGHGPGQRSVVLRAGGNDQDRAFLRDALQHRLCEGMPFMTSGYAPCVVLVNGAYWGLHEVRERMDDREVARRIGVPRKQITILADRAILYDGDEAEVARFNRMLARLEKLDARPPAFVDSVERVIDLDGFLSYMAAQFILGNADWPDQNVKYWRYTGAPDGVPGPRDGRWRFIMGDSDQGFGYNTGPDLDLFAQVLHKGTPVPRLFKACLRSEVVRERFRAVVLAQLEGDLSPDRMARMVVGMAGAIADAMPRHIERWRRPVSMDAWRRHVEDLSTFAEQRGPHVRRQLDHHFPARP